MSETQRDIHAEFPDKLKFLFAPCRYKVARGGRGSGKSWGFARALLLQGMQQRLRVLCAREVQVSIKQSVHQLLKDQIYLLGLEFFYTVYDASIRGLNGTEFTFTGLSTLTVDQIKSYEGYDICWVEEGQTISKRSWDILIPTIRKESSEIWISYNPDLETDETHQRFTVNQPDNCVNVEMNWRDNPWFNDVLEEERRYCLKYRPDDYDNIWEGKCRRAIHGAFYAEEIKEAEAESRITHIPIEKAQVHTAWDLGIGDSTAIWFFQLVGREIHLIDYYEQSGEGMAHYAKVLQDKNYVYGDHFAPHDVEQRELGTGLSLLNRALDLGIRFTVVPRHNVEHGIEIVRSTFPRCWFDETRCKRGVDALRSYRKEYDEKHDVFKTRPLHDWASHGADAFRYLCMAVKQFSPGTHMSQAHADRLYEQYAPPIPS
jgi:phage terminase large subunit